LSCVPGELFSAFVTGAHRCDVAGAWDFASGLNPGGNILDACVIGVLRDGMVVSGVCEFR